MMDRELLHAFCHLNPARSFTYGDGVSALLCHRCSGIYGAFLLICLIGYALRWNGRWGRWSPFWQYCIVVALFTGSLLQVMYEEYSGLPPTGAFSRFLLGCLAGVGLVQLKELVNLEKGGGQAGSWWWLVFFSGLFFAHYWGSSLSFAYCALSSAGGLILLYVLMNKLVVNTFFPLSGRFSSLSIALFMVAVEWVFLYYAKRGIYG